MTTSDEISQAEFFRTALAAFRRKHEFVGNIVNSVAGHNIESRRVWANLLCSRLWIVGRSLLTLCDQHPRETAGEQDTIGLDHSSIAALERTLLESWVVFVYLSEPTISEAEWNLRKTIFGLYDTTTRYKILKHIGDRKTEDGRALRERINKTRTAI